MNTALLLFASFVGAFAAKVPLTDMIPTCELRDKSLNACVVKSANLLVPYLSKGIKSYGFPPLDPLRVPKMDVGQDSGPVTLKLQLIDTTHLGLSTLNFRSASIDPRRNEWVLNGTLPYYSLSGRYKGNGRILLVPLAGDGKANFTFWDTGIDFVIHTSPKKDRSEVFLEVKNLRVHFQFRRSSVTLTNLFGDNKVLGDRTSRFLKENSEEVVNGLKGTLEDVYSALYTNLLRRITSSVPYSQLFKSA